jgi:hypothetical protein
VLWKLLSFRKYEKEFAYFDTFFVTLYIFLVKLQNIWSYVLFIYPIIIPIKCTVFIYFVLFSTIFEKHSNIKENNLKITHCTYRCLKIREFRIQSVVGKDPVELEKYLEKKIRSS